MKCTLMPGVESISGSFKAKDGSRIVFKTFSKPSVNRKNGETETRMYLSFPKKRKTPLSERERQTRSKFADAAGYYRDLSEEQKQRYQREYKKAQYKYHGKMYATLRGYVIARFFANDIAN